MSAHRTSIHRINLQGRKIPLQSPIPGLSNKRIRSRLRAIYPYSLGVNLRCYLPMDFLIHSANCSGVSVARKSTIAPRVPSSRVWNCTDATFGL